MSRSPEDSRSEAGGLPDSAVSDAERTIRDRRADGPGLVSRLPGMVYQARLEPGWPMEFVSPGALALTGYDPSTFLVEGERTFEELILEEDRERVWREVEEAVDEGRPFSVEYRIEHRKGGIRYVWDHGHPVPSPGGEPLGVEGFILDVTDRVHLTTRLRDAQRRETVGRLSGVVAHDFNNFLTGIIGSLELARPEIEEGSAVHRNVTLALESAERARRLTRQLLVVSRGRPQKRQVVELGSRVLEFNDFLRQLVGSPIRLELELDDGEGELPLFIDPSLLDQILLNLVVNAREAIEGYGRIEIATERRGREAVLRVADDGCGMDEGTLARVFDPFFTTKEGGTGLGLATVLEIVEECGGRVDVDSRPGEGTVFEISFPLSRRKSRRGPGAPAGRAVDPAARGERVLVVDDDATVLRVIEQALERFGYDVAVAGDPEACRRTIAALDGIPDLVLMDVTLPETSGIALAEALRDEGLVDRVLFMSGYAPAEMVEGAELLRDGHYLEKPFAVDELVAAVSRALTAPGDEETGTGAA